MPPVVPAELAFAGDGIPYSTLYADIYHSGQGGLEQARHVFLAGNRLPERWQSCEQFVILETGFGLGLNFLATWQTWTQAANRRARRLHYVAIEKHPFRTEDLARLHERWPELGPFAARLRDDWPPAVSGLHRLDFGDVILTLALGDAADILPQLSLTADAIYLDGFAPDRNPQLWSESVIARVRRLAAPGTTLATWTVAGDVRRRLAGADFVLKKTPGHGNKRDMLTGILPGSAARNPSRPQTVAVIGAGIAGASVADALSRRGYAVTVLDAASEAAQGASGNLAGVFRPLPSQNDGTLARVLRAGFLLGRRQYAKQPGVRAGWTGVLHVARDERHEIAQQATVAEQSLPPEFCRYLDRKEASALAGWPVASGGWWFPNAGWINPPSLCGALLSGIEFRPGFEVAALEPQEGRWRVVGPRGIIQSDAVVIANGIGARALLPEAELPLRPGRGQVSLIPEAATPGLDIVVTRLGYVTPVIDGSLCAGATMNANDMDPRIRLDDHKENLFRLEMALPSFASGVDPAALAGRVSFRPMSPDRLPMVGAMPNQAGLWMCNGFGARGLVFAQICAELLACQMSGEPLPLERELAEALDPARFATGTRKSPRRTVL